MHSLTHRHTNMPSKSLLHFSSTVLALQSVILTPGEEQVVFGAREGVSDELGAWLVPTPWVMFTCWPPEGWRLWKLKRGDRTRESSHFLYQTSKNQGVAAEVVISQSQHLCKKNELVRWQDRMGVKFGWHIMCVAHNQRRQHNLQELLHLLTHDDNFHHSKGMLRVLSACYYFVQKVQLETYFKLQARCWHLSHLSSLF